MRPLCKRCKIRAITSKGKGRYRAICARCHKKDDAIHKGNACVSCGFVPIHHIQLDVDHIDGNHNNRAISNLQTLCANCHRLKTFLQKWNT